MHWHIFNCTTVKLIASRLSLTTSILFGKALLDYIKLSANEPARAVNQFEFETSSDVKGYKY